MLVKDMMNHYPMTVQPDDLVWLATQKMAWAGVRHLPVLRDGALVGLVSERDLAVHHARLEDRENRGDDTQIESIMHPHPQTASPEDSITEVAGRMATSKISCLPVVDKGALVGIITTTDILSSQVQAALSAAPPRGKRVEDVMSRDVEVAHPDDHLLDAAGRMQNRTIRHLPVINGEGTVVGLLSDRDVRTAIGDPMRAFDDAKGAAGSTRLDALRVEDAMSRPPVTTTPDRLCSEVARDFVGMRASAVPVVDDSGTLVGMLSYIDLLRGLAS
jgi:CBS domain-containing protein